MKKGVGTACGGESLTNETRFGPPRTSKIYAGLNESLRNSLLRYLNPRLQKSIDRLIHTSSKMQGPMNQGTPLEVL